MADVSTLTLTLSEQAKVVFKAIPVLLMRGLITEDEADRMIWDFIDAFGLQEVKENG